MAQITITVPDAALPRIKAALRGYFPSGINPDNPPSQLPEPTNAQYLAKAQEIMRDALKREVRDFEVRSAVQNAEASIGDVEGIV